MKIQKFEQSGCIIESESGFRIAIDIGNKTSLNKLVGVPPVDVFLVSHIHGDHFDTNNIKMLSPKQVFLPEDCYRILFYDPGVPPKGSTAIPDAIPFHGFGIIMQNGFEYDSVNFSFQAFHVDHGPHVTVPLRDNFGFLLKCNGKQIYFAGDMYNPSGITVSELSVDYAFIPVGGYYTFGPKEAFDFAKSFANIETLVPMHYEKNNYIDPMQKDLFVELAQDDFDIQLLV